MFARPVLFCLSAAVTTTLLASNVAGAIPFAYWSLVDRTSISFQYLDFDVIRNERIDYATIVTT